MMFLVVAIAPWLATGCAHPAKTVSFKFVDLRAEPTGTIEPRKYEVKRGETVFVDAKPIEPLATPGFPVGAQKPGADPITIVVKLAVGADGRVENIQRSLADFAAFGKPPSDDIRSLLPTRSTS